MFHFSAKNMNARDPHLPIGVFDSGVGGLTVLKALQARMPHENFIYLGDTARLPYGTKSQKSIVRYALQASAHLVKRKVKMLVIACNTASAAALSTLQQEFAPLPVVGVIEPGAQACCRNSSSGFIAVIGTESTIRGNAYPKAIMRLRPEARVVSKQCSLFVTLAEEGWTQGKIVEDIARKYLEHIFFTREAPDCLMLGCTHFPVFKDALQNVLGPHVHLVDSAEATARHVYTRLDQMHLFNGQSHAENTFLVTDDLQRFARAGSIFLNRPIQEEELELVDL